MFLTRYMLTISSTAVVVVSNTNGGALSQLEPTFSRGSAAGAKTSCGVEDSAYLSEPFSVAHLPRLYPVRRQSFLMHDDHW